MPSTPAPADEITVLVLGTYHMANPKRDLVKVDIRDTLGEERQKEICELNDRLAEFKPTKILVEAEPPAEVTMRSYREYISGNHALTANETEQIGFRLAHRLGHEQLYPADHGFDLGFEALMESAQRQGKTEVLKFMEEVPPKMGEILQHLDRSYSVGEILAAMNSPAGIAFNHGFYLELLDVDDGQEFCGAHVAAAWYERNLRIFSNIKRLAAPGDRLLVIFGAGHAKHLRDFVQQTRGWRLEDSLRYLPAPPDIEWSL